MRYPPFSKPLVEVFNRGTHPVNNVIYIYIGKNSWEKGKYWSFYRPTRTLILPPNHLPETYVWPVAGYDILVIETDSSRNISLIEDLAFVLFENGANSISAVFSDYSSIFFKKDFQHVG